MNGCQKERDLNLLLVKVPLEERQAVEVKQERLGAPVLLDIDWARHYCQHCRRVDVDKRRSRPLEKPVDLHGLVAQDLCLDSIRDPRRGSLNRERAVVVLVLELSALVVDAMILDRLSNQAETGVGRVDAYGVDEVQHKLQGLAEGARSRLHVHVFGDERPLGLGLLVAFLRLDALDDLDDPRDQLAQLSLWYQIPELVPTMPWFVVPDPGVGTNHEFQRIFLFNLRHTPEMYEPSVRC